MQMRLDKAPSDSYSQICRTFLMDQILEQIRPEQLLGLCFVLPAMIDPEKEEVFSTTFSLAGDQGEAGVIPVCALFFRIMRWRSSMTRPAVPMRKKYIPASGKKITPLSGSAAG